MPEAVVEAPVPTVVHVLNVSRAVDGIKWVAGRGPEPSEIMLVETMPGYAEAERGIAAIGQVANQVRKLMLKAGFLYDSYYWTYVVKYNLAQKGKKKVKVAASDIERCREALEAEIAKVKPRFIVTMGSVALKYFMGTIIP